MKRKIIVNKGYNSFTMIVSGKPSYTDVYDKNGKLVLRSIEKKPHPLTHVCKPGEYIVETDGEIVDIKIEKLNLQPILLSVTFSNLDDVFTNTEWFGIDEESERLSYIKPELIEYLSKEAFRLREQIIPDYKLQNAILGVYDEKTLASYRLTIQSFRNEFYRIKKAIEQAETLEELKAIKANFPEKILPG